MALSNNQWILVGVLVVLAVAFVVVLSNNNYSIVSDNEPLQYNDCGSAGNNLHDCCEKYYDINDLVKPACVGQWSIAADACTWVCDTNNSYP